MHNEGKLQNNSMYLYQRMPILKLDYLQRIGKNESPKKLVITSIPVFGAELHVSAIYHKF